MAGVTETEVQCPFCFEAITILVDTSEDRQSYVEDCSVCCHPNALSIRIEGEEAIIESEFEE